MERDPIRRCLWKPRGESAVARIRLVSVVLGRSRSGSVLWGGNRTVWLMVRLQGASEQEAGLILRAWPEQPGEWRGWTEMRKSRGGEKGSFGFACCLSGAPSMGQSWMLDPGVGTSDRGWGWGTHLHICVWPFEPWEQKRSELNIFHTPIPLQERKRMLTPGPLPPLDRSPSIALKARGIHVLSQLSLLCGRMHCAVA